MGALRLRAPLKRPWATTGLKIFPQSFSVYLFPGHHDRHFRHLIGLVCLSADLLDLLIPRPVPEHLGHLVVRTVAATVELFLNFGSRSTECWLVTQPA